MPQGRVGMIKTFQRAFASIGMPILYHTTQFYSVKQHRPVTQYHIKLVKVEEGSERAGSEEVFSTYYQLYVIFFLRDLWDYVNGRPIDTGNEIWNVYKEKHNVKIEDVIQ